MTMMMMMQVTHRFSFLDIQGFRRKRLYFKTKKATHSEAFFFQRSLKNFMLKFFP